MTPPPEVLEELHRLRVAVDQALASGEGIEEAEEAYRTYAEQAAAQGVTDGCSARAFGDVLDDGE